MEILFLIVGVLILFILMGVRKIQAQEVGKIIRTGKVHASPGGPAWIFLIPVVDKLVRVPVAPFHTSLPPQSAITRDEVPIQLQASISAEVTDPALVVILENDWRIALMSQLQNLMKDRLEDLDFSKLQDGFPAWVESIRQTLSASAAKFGVTLTGLEISNLSPRELPK